LARSDPPPQWIVVAAEPITDVDTTAADVLFELDHLLDERGQALVFAELKDPVRRKIDRYGLADELEPRHFFPTVEAAVDAWRASTGATWADPPSDVPVPPVSLPQPRPGAGTPSVRPGGLEHPPGGPRG
jgi:STAS domain-containing protein